MSLGNASHKVRYGETKTKLKYKLRKINQNATYFCLVNFSSGPLFALRPRRCGASRRRGPRVGLLTVVYSVTANSADKQTNEILFVPLAYEVAASRYLCRVEIYNSSTLPFITLNSKFRYGTVLFISRCTYRRVINQFLNTYFWRNDFTSDIFE